MLFRRKHKTFEHIYFESAAIKGRDSATLAVLDRGKKGWDKEDWKRTVYALAADAIDKKTVDHKGRVIEFKWRTFFGRAMILARWAKKFKATRTWKRAWELLRKIWKARSAKAKRRYLEDLRKLLGLSKKEAKYIEAHVSQAATQSRRRKSRR